MVETIEIFGMLLRVEQDEGERHDCWGCAFFNGNGCKASIKGDLSLTPCLDSDGNQTRHFLKLITENKD